MFIVGVYIPTLVIDLRMKADVSIDSLIATLQGLNFLFISFLSAKGGDEGRKKEKKNLDEAAQVPGDSLWCL